MFCGRRRIGVMHNSGNGPPTAAELRPQAPKAKGNFHIWRSLLFLLKLLEFFWEYFSVPRNSRNTETERLFSYILTWFGVCIAKIAQNFVGRHIWNPLNGTVPPWGLLVVSTCATWSRRAAGTVEPSLRDAHRKWPRKLAARSLC